jgi:hypothetical protein
LSVYWHKLIKTLVGNFQLSKFQSINSNKVERKKEEERKETKVYYRYIIGILLVYYWYIIGILLVYYWHIIGILLVYYWYIIGILLLSQLIIRFVSFLDLL